MPPTRPKSDITIRGGVVNVAASTSPTLPPRHQPDTPRTKKTVKVKTDHHVYPPDPTPPPEKPTPAAAAPPVPPPAEPENPPIITDDLTDENQED